MSKYPDSYPSLGKRVLRAVARRTPGLASRSNKPIGGSSNRPIEGKRCSARTAVGKPCSAWPLAGSQLCSMHTPGMAQALGSRGGAAGVGATAKREREAQRIGDVTAGVPRGTTLSDLLEHDDDGVGDGASSMSTGALSGIPLTQPVGVDPVASEGNLGPDFYVDPAGNRIALPYGRLPNGMPNLAHLNCGGLTESEDAELFPGLRVPIVDRPYRWTSSDYEGS